ncbi:MAG: phosphoenolpyruvate--protein phosphotransferase [Lysobacterales bacterium]
MPTRFELAGIMASRGMALGRARLIYPLRFEVDTTVLTAPESESEAAQFTLAVAAAHAQLRVVRERIPQALADELGEFIDAHASILDDPDFTGAILARIRNERIRAATALKYERDKLAAAFDDVEDPYLKARRDDFDQLIARLYAALKRGEAGSNASVEAGDAPIGELLVADTVGPAELVRLYQHGTLGFITVGGNTFAHSAIMARSLYAPMACGVHEAFAQLRDGDLLLLDADHGRVVVHPDALDLKRLRLYQREAQRSRRERGRLRGAETLTADGSTVLLHVNAEQPAEIAEARRLGASGVGLFRTEFLFLRDGGLPDEDAQFRVYRDAVVAMGGKPVTLRTLDLGADKASPALDLAPEPNPALGLRGLRLSLARRPMFVMQLRAMLRAAQYGPVRILLPMLGSIEEARAARGLLDTCRTLLAGEGVDVGDDVLLGGMIEIPAAALIADDLLGELDFLSIGSNDLVQYLLAADRDNDAVSDAYDPLHPAVLRLIARVVEAAARAGKPVTLCGELASDPRYLPLLLTLGLSDFSMRVSALLEVRAALRTLSPVRLRKRLPALLGCPDRAAIETMLANIA